jgi:chromate reductase, NAD(P)H dehydrogenase (quinone)
MTISTVEILAIPGSLRRDSVNHAALRAAAAAGAVDGVTVTIDSLARTLPLFDPDLEVAPPSTVVRFRAAIERAAGILMAVPEYAHGIPGAFKNALDWTVGAGSLARKPVTVLSVAAPHRGAQVRVALQNVLTAIDADQVFRAVPVTASDLDGSGSIASEPVIASLRQVVAELAARASEAIAA